MKDGEFSCIVYYKQVVVAVKCKNVCCNFIQGMTGTSCSSWLSGFGHLLFALNYKQLLQLLTIFSVLLEILGQ